MNKDVKADYSISGVREEKSHLISRLYRRSTSFLRVLPDFLIIGGQKCGTFSLFKYLSNHPGVFPPLRRDIYFFDLNSNYKKGISLYRKFFPSLLTKKYIQDIRQEKFLTGEASPTYIFHPHVPKRVHDAIPLVKLIVLLRNPVDRAYSHYMMSVRRNREKRDFERAIKEEIDSMGTEMKKMKQDENYYSMKSRYFAYLERGIYVDQLKRWYEIFPSKQILVLKSEDLFQNPVSELKHVFDFLGLADIRYDKYEIYNKAEYDQMDDTIRKQLREFFKPYNEQLSKFLGKDFDWD